jgi:Flp pilus assembly secretin CpaC
MVSQKSRHGLLLVPLIILVALLGALWGAPSSSFIGNAKAAEAAKKDEAGDTIALEIGKAQLIRLTATPDVVMLGNPAVAEVVVEDNGLLFLLGQEPGETNLLILDDAGKILLSSSVVVVPLSKRRVTVDRGPEVFTLSCSPRCVPVATPQGTGATTAAAAAADTAAAGAPGQPVDAATGGGAAGGMDAAAIASALSGLMGSTPATH